MDAWLEAVRIDSAGALIGFDYDGTLSPIVDDPATAGPEPSAIGALAELAGRVGHVAVITGRPARVVVDLAGFASAPGLERLVVIGHYGLERWDGRSGEFSSRGEHPGVAVVRDRLPRMLSTLGLGSAAVEDKGLSVAVHVRRLPEPSVAFDTLLDPLRLLAADTGLVAEPGRLVVELRPPDVHKGQALLELVEETSATSVAFVGDDLGDLAAFDAVDQLRDRGLPGLLVCSGSVEVATLADRADVVVDGPPGVAALIREWVAALR